jgi:hypothetical protein
VDPDAQTTIVTRRRARGAPYGPGSVTTTSRWSRYISPGEWGCWRSWFGSGR